MFGQQVMSGLATGSLYALTAVAVVVVFRNTRTINLAQGDFSIWSHASLIGWPTGHLACAAGSVGCPDRDIFVREYSMDPENIDVGVRTLGDFPEQQTSVGLALGEMATLAVGIIREAKAYRATDVDQSGVLRDGGISQKADLDLGGVDLLVIETQFAYDEADAAFRAARAVSDLPIVVERFKGRVNWPAPFSHSPPSMTTHSPLMYSVASETRNAARSASSSCRPARLSGMRFSAPAASSGVGISRSHAPGVGKGPGAIAFMVMP